MEGWIKLHREIMDHWLWKRNPIDYRAAWLELIMMANHDTNKICVDSQVIEIKPGQRWTSIEKLAEQWNWDRKKVRRFLNLLQSDGMIFYETTNRGTLITIVNYAVYQDFSEKKGQQTGHLQGQPEGRQRDISRDTNKKDIRRIKKDKKLMGGDFE